MREAVRADRDQGMAGEVARLVPAEKGFGGDVRGAHVGAAREFADRVEHLGFRPRPQRPVDPLIGERLLPGGPGLGAKVEAGARELHDVEPRYGLLELQPP